MDLGGIGFMNVPSLEEMIGYLPLIPGDVKQGLCIHLVSGQVDLLQNPLGLPSSGLSWLTHAALLGGGGEPVSARYLSVCLRKLVPLAEAIGKVSEDLKMSIGAL